MSHIATALQKEYKQNCFRWIECELKHFPQLKKEIDMLKDEIISTRPGRDAYVRIPRQYSKSDPTFATTVRLLSNKRLRQMELVYAAIGTVFEGLPPEKQEFIQMKYWSNKYSDSRIATELFVSVSTLYNWRNGILTAIAAEMGYL
ncbi:MAG: hypothetical protein ACOX4K_08735 [Bacillota bacterium]